MNHLLRALLPLGLGLILAPPPPAALAADRCPGAETTLAMSECLGQRLEQSDLAVAEALKGVAASAQRLPGEPAQFRRIWRTFLEERGGGADPAAQLKAFQKARRQACQYVNSMSLQGSGFGLFVISCELDLNDALLRQFRP